VCKVWESVLRSPEEMLQRHQDGTFYTHAPTDMWEAINQHISLATSTQSDILHVMIADKVVTSLTPLIDQITDYVATALTQETADKPELKEIELEFVSALANDTAMHIEEVLFACYPCPMSHDPCCFVPGDLIIVVVVVVGYPTHRDLHHAEHSGED
jgi:hypothetical protein